MNLRAAKTLLATTRGSSRSISTQASALPLTYHPEVWEALQAEKPVVALETAIVTHGMPNPINLNTAVSCENIIRSTGAVPATIGMIAGRIHIGLERKQLEQLADSSNTSRVKLSRRDLGPAMASKKDGGTTIAGTMILAHLAGIKVFATGGLGGVHRGGENSMDISADLTELGRTPVAVVSAGAKSILDLGRTLEFLETQGVTVSTFGESNEFPAFFSRKSGFMSPWSFNSAERVAEMLYASHQLQLQSGALIAVPIPAEFESAGLIIQDAVDQAVRESEENGMSKQGKDATPWLLRRVTEITNGESIQNNIALIENTALVGGRIAVEYARLLSQSEPSSSVKQYPAAPTQKTIDTKATPSTPHQQSEHRTETPVSLVVVGATAVDITARAESSSSALITNSTVPGKVSTSLGGVARNMAEAAFRASPLSLRSSTLLISPIGADSHGSLIREQTASIGMRTDGFLLNSDYNLGKGNEDSPLPRRSPVCNMSLSSDGDLIGGVADFSAMEALTSQEIIEVITRHSPKLIALDGNITVDVLKDLVDYCAKRSIPIWYEPTSVAKSTKILLAIRAQFTRQADTFTTGPIAYASPNILELQQLFHEAREDGAYSSQGALMAHPRWFEAIDRFGLDSTFSDNLQRLGGSSAQFLVQKGIAQMTIQLLPYFQHLVVKCGDQGVFVGAHLAPQQARTSGWIHSSIPKSDSRIVVKTSQGSVLILQHFPAQPLKPSDSVNVTGAGDSLVGSLLASIASSERNPWHQPSTLEAAVEHAQHAAVLSLRSSLAVSPELTSSIN